MISLLFIKDYDNLYTYYKISEDKLEHISTFFSKNLFSLELTQLPILKKYIGGKQEIINLREKIQSRKKYEYYEIYYEKKDTKYEIKKELYKWKHDIRLFGKRELVHLPNQGYIEANEKAIIKLFYIPIYDTFKKNIDCILPQQFTLYNLNNILLSKYRKKKFDKDILIENGNIYRDTTVPSQSKFYMDYCPFDMLGYNPVINSQKNAIAILDLPQIFDFYGKINISKNSIQGQLFLKFKGKYLRKKIAMMYSVFLTYTKYVNPYQSTYFFKKVWIVPKVYISADILWNNEDNTFCF